MNMVQDNCWATVLLTGDRACSLSSGSLEIYFRLRRWGCELNEDHMISFWGTQ